MGLNLVSYLIIIACAGLLITLSRLFKKNAKQLPPGPPKLPIIGNAHQIPSSYPWRGFREWTKQYGPVVNFDLGQSKVILLGNFKAADDLLNKRSAIYSSRPHTPMGNDIVSKGNRLLLMPYGPKWRANSKIQMNCVNIRQSQKYTDLQDTESKQVISDLLDSNDFTRAFHRYSSSLIFSLAYGKRMERGDEPEVKAIDHVMENFLYAARAGTWWVDSLPFLNRLPEFLAPWKRKGEEMFQFHSSHYLKFMAEGTKTSSWNWAKQILASKDSQGLSRMEMAYDVGILYEAGSDTTTMALEIFTMAMVLNPEVLRKLQKELDEVSGTSRLPTFNDSPNLPYLNAVVSELLRWRPVTAGGIPHAVTQDDEYMGYHIPAGATVIGNHWSISLDEGYFPEPDTFRPERWLENPNLPTIAFGFGRRICPGQHIARNSLLINASRLAWTFEIGYDYEEIDGQKVRCEIDPLNFTQGFNSRPSQFRARFTPRDADRERIVRQAWRETEKDVDTLLGQIQEKK